MIIFEESRNYAAHQATDMFEIPLIRDLKVASSEAEETNVTNHFFHNRPTLH
jgi:hypothetical protein